MIYGEEDSKWRCRQTGIVYEMSCKSCNSKYIGETSRNGYTNGLESIIKIMKKGQNLLNNWYALPIEVGGEAGDRVLHVGVLVLAKGLVVPAVARHTEL